MIREIKFRGKTKNGVFKFGSYHNIIGKTSINNIEKNLDLHFILETNMPDYSGWYLQDSYKENAIEKNTLGQFTGLRDKNGIDIYEGDILGISTPVVLVTFDYCSFVFDWIDKHYITNRKPLEPLFRNIYLFQIFGNIHENPELIK